MTALRQNNLRERIAELLADGPLAAHELAARAGADYMATRSCLRGMINRREVVEIKPKVKGTPHRYRLKEATA